MKRVRVRFAPSPTGPLHMGGVRTALYNYLFAKQHHGDFILRIEDTDSQRYVAGAEEYIIESLRWCGIFPNEGVLENGEMAVEPSPNHPHAPYRQSQRKSLYRAYAQQLVAQGDAYYAFDSAESLEALRQSAESKGEAFVYGPTSRATLDNSLAMEPHEVAKRLEEERWVIRFKIPQDHEVVFQDLIRGEIKVQSNTLDDKVLWKSIDGLPTYHLANVVDDHLMEISHVIRGEEWLPSLPLHILLYRAFQWQDTQPLFAHLSLLLKPDGKGKLSKRDGDRLGFPVFPLEWKSPEGVSKGYREEGYFPDAFVNMLALMGWNPGTEQELISLDELTHLFSLERVVKSGARFNLEKAHWFNQQYLRTKENTQLAQEFAQLLTEAGITFDPSKLLPIVELIKERALFVKDFIDLSDYFFTAPTQYDEKLLAKHWKEDMPQKMVAVKNFLFNIEPFTAEMIEHPLAQFIQASEWGMGGVMNALRLCIVGAAKGPGMAAIMSVIGKEETLRRIERML
ncbi:MAG: glutamate--tRNA ligase [Bacteroidales bacterium]|nr:glutamate--tRNA ligase [Bacteroidales bacterium]